MSLSLEIPFCFQKKRGYPQVVRSGFKAWIFATVRPDHAAMDAQESVGLYKESNRTPAEYIVEHLLGSIDLCE